MKWAPELGGRSSNAPFRRDRVLVEGIVVISTCRDFSPESKQVYGLAPNIDIRKPFLELCAQAEGAFLRS